MSHLSDNYSNREIDLKFSAVHTRFDAQDARLGSQDVMLQKILTQATKTNGRVTKMEKIILVVGTVVVVLLVVNGSRFVDFLSAVFK